MISAGGVLSISAALILNGMDYTATVINNCLFLKCGGADIHGAGRRGKNGSGARLWGGMLW